MKTAPLLTIVVLLSSALTACTSSSTTAIHQNKPSTVTNEPALVLKPFQINALTWFATNQASLTAQGKTTLNKLINQYTGAKRMKLVSAQHPFFVIGHTDSRASVGYNQKLSERRANTVAHYLSDHGVPSAAIITQGKSELQPIASNRTRAGMQKNRRVEIHIKGPAVNVVYD